MNKWEIKYLNAFFALACLLVVAIYIVSSHKFEPPVVLRAPANDDKYKDEISKMSPIVGITLQSVVEFKKPIQEAEKFGYEFSIYGGISRELLYFVLTKVKQMGSTEKYLNWLREKKEIHLVDWHRVNSDLDIHLIEGSQAKTSSRNEVVENIKNMLSDSLFSASVDINHHDEFFEKFDLSKGHLEPFSNILITSKGFYHSEKLNYVVNGQNVNLGYWGEYQFLKGEFDFELGSPQDKYLSIYYLNLKQYLRYLKMLTEYPEFKIGKNAKHALRKLQEEITVGNRKKYIELIKSESKMKDSRIFKALNRTMIYSRDSALAQEVLMDRGVVELFNEAGFGEKIGSPLLRRNFEVGPHPQLLGKEIEVYHGTTLDGAQNISGGAIYISDGKDLDVKKTSEKALGRGFYTTSSLESARSYGIYCVSLKLSADAVIGVDVVQKGNVYLIKTLNAIATNKNGSLKIHPISYDTLLKDFILSIKNESFDERGEALVSTEAKMRTISSIMKFIDPMTRDSDRSLFVDILKASTSQNLNSFFIKEFFVPERINRFLKMDENSFEKVVNILAHLFSSLNGSIAINDNIDIYGKIIDIVINRKKGSVINDKSLDRLYRLVKVSHSEYYFWSHIDYRMMSQLIVGGSSKLHQLWKTEFNGGNEEVGDEWKKAVFNKYLKSFFDNEIREVHSGYSLLNKIFEFSKANSLNQEFLTVLLSCNCIDSEKLNFNLKIEIERALLSSQVSTDLILQMVENISMEKTSKTIFKKIPFEKIYQTEPSKLFDLLLIDKNKVVLDQLNDSIIMNLLVRYFNSSNAQRVLTTVSLVDIRSEEAALNLIRLMSLYYSKNFHLNSYGPNKEIILVEKLQDISGIIVKHKTIGVEIQNLQSILESSQAKAYRLSDIVNILSVLSGNSVESESKMREILNGWLPISEKLFDVFFSIYSHSRAKTNLMTALAIRMCGASRPPQISLFKLEQLVTEIKKSQADLGKFKQMMVSPESIYNHERLFSTGIRCERVFIKR